MGLGIIAGGMMIEESLNEYYRTAAPRARALPQAIRGAGGWEYPGFGDAAIPANPDYFAGKDARILVPDKLANFARYNYYINYFRAHPNGIHAWWLFQFTIYAGQGMPGYPPGAFQPIGEPDPLLTPNIWHPIGKPKPVGKPETRPEYTRPVQVSPTRPPRPRPPDVGYDIGSGAISKVPPYGRPPRNVKETKYTVKGAPAWVYEIVNNLTESVDLLHALAVASGYKGGNKWDETPYVVQEFEWLFKYGHWRDIEGNALLKALLYEWATDQAFGRLSGGGNSSIVGSGFWTALQGVGAGPAM
jgi:hypothetical protein